MKPFLLSIATLGVALAQQKYIAELSCYGSQEYLVIAGSELCVPVLTDSEWDFLLKLPFSNPTNSTTLPPTTNSTTLPPTTNSTTLPPTSNSTPFPTNSVMYRPSDGTVYGYSTPDCQGEPIDVLQNSCLQLVQETPVQDFIVETTYNGNGCSEDLVTEVNVIPSDCSLGLQCTNGGVLESCGAGTASDTTAGQCSCDCFVGDCECEASVCASTLGEVTESPTTEAPSIATSEPTEAPFQVKEKKADDDDELLSTGAIAGIIVGAFLVFVIIASALTKRATRDDNTGGDPARRSQIPEDTGRTLSKNPSFSR